MDLKSLYSPFEMAALCGACGRLWLSWCGAGHPATEGSAVPILAPTVHMSPSVPGQDTEPSTAPSGLGSALHGGSRCVREWGHVRFCKALWERHEDVEKCSPFFNLKTIAG